MSAPPITIIELSAPVFDCRVCEAELVGTLTLGYGIPMYEDDVLPNDWPGEWGGFPACRRCYDAQQRITEPTPVSELLATVSS